MQSVIRLLNPEMLTCKHRYQILPALALSVIFLCPILQFDQWMGLNRQMVPPSTTMRIICGHLNLHIQISFLMFRQISSHWGRSHLLPSITETILGRAQMEEVFTLTMIEWSWPQMSIGTAGGFQGLHFLVSTVSLLNSQEDYRSSFSFAVIGRIVSGFVG